MPFFTRYTTVKDILEYLQKNPVWVSAFTSGEGSFTGSVSTDVRALWGMWPQAELNISQLMTDKNLLMAIKAFFNDSGGVYNRKCGVGCYAVRDLEEIRKDIIPFFLKYPLLGAKSYEFEKWVEIVEIMSKKSYLNNDLAAKESLILLLQKLAKLNARDTRQAVQKLTRNQFLINWLISLNNVPTKQQKIEMIASLNALKSETKSLKK